MLPEEEGRIYAPWDVAWHVAAALGIIVVASLLMSPWMPIGGIVGFFVREAWQSKDGFRFWKWSVQKSVEFAAPAAVLILGAIIIGALS